MEDKVNVKIDTTVTEEEKDLVQRLADGRTAEEIAIVVGVNRNTLQSRINFLKVRLNCNNTPNLVAFFLRKKLID